MGLRDVVKGLQGIYQKAKNNLFYQDATVSLKPILKELKSVDNDFSNIERLIYNMQGTEEGNAVIESIADVVETDKYDNLRLQEVILREIFSKGKIQVSFVRELMISPKVQEGLKLLGEEKTQKVVEQYDLSVQPLIMECILKGFFEQDSTDVEAYDLSNEELLLKLINGGMLTPENRRGFQQIALHNNEILKMLPYVEKVCGQDVVQDIFTYLCEIAENHRCRGEIDFKAITPDDIWVLADRGIVLQEYDDDVKLFVMRRILDYQLERKEEVNEFLDFLYEKHEQINGLAALYEEHTPAILKQITTTNRGIDGNLKAGDVWRRLLDIYDDDVTATVVEVFQESKLEKGLTKSQTRDSLLLVMVRCNTLYWMNPPEGRYVERNQVPVEEAIKALYASGSHCLDGVLHLEADIKNCFPNAPLLYCAFYTGDAGIVKAVADRFVVSARHKTYFQDFLDAISMTAEETQSVEYIEKLLCIERNPIYKKPINGQGESLFKEIAMQRGEIVRAIDVRYHAPHAGAGLSLTEENLLQGATSEVEVAGELGIYKK